MRRYVFSRRGNLVIPVHYFEDTLMSVYNQVKQRREARIGYVTIEGNR